MRPFLGHAEFLDALGELGPAGAGEPAESGEFVFGAGALFGGLADALGHRVPPGFELLGVPHGGGQLAQSREVVLDGDHLAAPVGLGVDPEPLGVALSGLAVTAQLSCPALLALSELTQRGVGESAVLALGPVPPVSGLAQLGADAVGWGGLLPIERRLDLTRPRSRLGFRCWWGRGVVELRLADGGAQRPARARPVVPRRRARCAGWLG